MGRQIYSHTHTKNQCFFSASNLDSISAKMTNRQILERETKSMWVGEPSSLLIVEEASPPGGKRGLVERENLRAHCTCPRSNRRWARTLQFRTSGLEPTQALSLEIKKKEKERKNGRERETETHTKIDR